MSEEQLKFILKQIVDNSNRPLSDLDRKLIKQAIDKSRNALELITSILAILSAA